MPKPRWYLALQAAGRAMESAFKRTGLAVFDADEFDHAAEGIFKRRMSGIWIPRLVEMNLVAPAWEIEVPPNVEYTVTFFGREILDLSQKS